MRNLYALLGLAFCIPVFAQPPPDLCAILERLSRLEQQNRELTEQVQQLRQQLGVSDPQPVENALTPVVTAPLAESITPMGGTSRTRSGRKQRIEIRPVTGST